MMHQARQRNGYDTFATLRSAARAAICDRRLSVVLLLAAIFSLTATPALAQSSPSDQQFVFAHRLMQRGDLELSAQAFDEFLGNFPRDERVGDALYFRALVARRQGDNAAAAKYLNRYDGGKLVQPAFVNLLRGQVYSDLGQHRAALEALEAIKLEQMKPAVVASVWFLRGHSYRGLGNLDAAAQAFDSAATVDSSLKPRAMVEAARAMAEMGRVNDAVGLLRQTLALDDASITPLAARLAGDLSFDNGEPAEAIGFYQRVTQRHQSSAQFGPSVVGIMWARNAMDQPGQVVQTYEQTKASLTGRDAAAGAYLAGLAKLNLGQPRAAEPLLTAAQGVGVDDPLYDDVVYQLAVAQFRQGDHARMSQSLDKLLRAAPKSPLIADGQFLRAAAAAKQRDTARAAEMLGSIIDAEPAHPYRAAALLQRARLYESQGEDEAALWNYAEYFRADPLPDPTTDRAPTDEQQTALLRLLALYNQVGNHAQAIALADTALGVPLPPRVEQEVRFRLALAQLRREQFQAALATLDALDERFPAHTFQAQAAYYRGLLQLGQDQLKPGTTTLRAAAKNEELPLSLRVNALRVSAVALREDDQDAAAFDTLLALEKLASRDALTVPEKLWLGAQHVERDQPREALGYLEPMVEVNPAVSVPQRSEALYHVGRALTRLGEFEMGRQAFLQVLALGRGYETQSRLALARSLASERNYEEALAEYEALIPSETSAVAAEALYESGRIYGLVADERARAGDEAGQRIADRESKKYYSRLTLLYGFPQLSPMPERAHLALYEITLRQGEDNAAGGHLDDLIKGYPDSAYATLAKALKAGMAGRRSEAVFLLKKVRDEAEDDSYLRERAVAALTRLEGGSR